MIMSQAGRVTCLSQLLYHTGGHRLDPCLVLQEGREKQLLARQIWSHAIGINYLLGH
ncbi:hypothetical protein KJ567_04175 [Candidatus Bipolaricaulota bacterium]|nr:hypothetical protein [Candidatus Bipolaricaulota bacterium]